MNRLILIGNGFDLAHKMPTRYNDFLLGYFKNAFAHAGKGEKYIDKLMMVEPHDYGQPGRSFESWKSTDDLIQHCYEHNALEKFLYHSEVPNGRTTVKLSFRVYISSVFLKKLIMKCNITNWVEIENEYYSELKNILKHPKQDYINKQLKSLNDSMEGVIEGLHTYLESLNCCYENRQFEDILKEPINLSDIPHLKEVGVETPKKTMILNFNYTPTIYPYLRRLDSKLADSIIVNNIHGALKDLNNRIIFGFGDELDEHYQTMEKSSAKGLFRYIKSFWYFRTRNYHDLIRFIESDSFQVFVWGHSCGLSDRTMLNMVFEHKNCKSIKIYYYKDGDKNNYPEITEDISRHFSDKAMLRAKVTPFPDCSPLPQGYPIVLH